MSQATATTLRESVQCAIAGAGPAGMMLGFLLARAGIEVSVFEKHADFLRDFRGDTIHPSTLELMYELGLLEEFLRRPHQEARELRGWIGNEQVVVADFTHLPTHCGFIALMPQWDFLNFLASEAVKYPSFHLHMQADVVDLIETTHGVGGLVAETPAGRLETTAALVVGADGRHSSVRRLAGLDVEDLGAPIDVLWFRLPRHPGDPADPMGRFEQGRIMVLIDRGDYWQCGYVIPKGRINELKAAGLEAFRGTVSQTAPFMGDRVGELNDWDAIKLLTVRVDRLRQWARPGLLCIGDAAHAMSPVGGVGINLAIQDAVAAANLLAEPLRSGVPTLDELARVQGRRMLPTRVTQWLQVAIQNRIISPVLERSGPLALPWPLKLVRRFPILRRIPARLVGMGVRPEHIRTPEVLPRSPQVAARA